MTDTAAVTSRNSIASPLALMLYDVMGTSISGINRNMSMKSQRENARLGPVVGQLALDLVLGKVTDRNFVRG
jgi:hypothetical protein